MKKSVDVVDLFSEEINKKEKNLDKKIRRARKKEEKKNKKLQKELEEKEEIEFQDYLDKKKKEQLEIIENDDELVKAPKKENKFYQETFNVPKKEQIVEDINNIELKKEQTPTLNDILNIEENNFKLKEEHHPFLNFLIGLFSICLLVLSCDYIIYNSITNYKDMITMINSILLVCMTVFYLLSIIIKKLVPKKLCQILSILFIISFMAYHLFII